MFEIDGLSWSVATRPRGADEVLDRINEAFCRAEAAQPAADTGEPSDKEILAGAELTAGYEEGELPAALRPEFTADLATLAAGRRYTQQSPGWQKHPSHG